MTAHPASAGFRQLHQILLYRSHDSPFESVGQGWHFVETPPECVMSCHVMSCHVMSRHVTSCHVMSWQDISRNHRTSTRHRSETIGIAWRAVRWVNEGTSAVLLKSGLDDKWWADPISVAVFCETMKTSNRTGKDSLWTAFWRTFSWANNTPWVHDWISSDCCRWPVKTPAVSQEVPTCNLHWICGVCGGASGKNILVADVEGLENLDAFEIHARRVNAKVVLMTKKGEEFVISFRRSVKLAGRDKVFRKSTLIQSHLAPGRGAQRWSWRRVGRVSSVRPTSGWRRSAKRFLRITFIAITLNQELNYVLEEGTFPRPIKYIDVVRRTNTTFDVLLESRIDDYRNVDGGRELSWPWTVFLPSSQ